MSRKEKRNLEGTKRHKGLGTFVGFIFGMYLAISVYLIYNLYKLTGIETLIRYIVIGILIVTDLFLIFKFFRLKRKSLIRKYIGFLFVILLFGAGEFFVAYTLNKGLNVVDNISAKEYKTYKTSLVTMNNGKLSKVSDITDNTKIGRVNNKDDIENYVLSKDIMSKNDISDNVIVDYEDPITLLYELYEGKVDAAFISGSYIDIYKTMQKFENIATDLKELAKYSKKMKVKKDKTLQASTKSITEPFTMLLMGVDTKGNITETSGLGDSLTLITFNPDTLNVTILSIPRDTFVPISCYRNVRSKITHAASGGDKCMISTIQNFFDVNIDYYIKVNFTGLINIVDALGGIDVDVPYSFCESDEDRTFYNPIFVEKGMQHLGGREALGLARNRKTTPSCGAKWNQGTRNDFVRGQNQQLVINAIINKAKSLDSIDKFYALLDAVGGSMVTNMDRKQILSFYNVFKKILVYSSDLTGDNNIIDMQKMYLNGSGQLIQDGIMTSMNLYEYVPSTQSLNAIKKAMKVNLGLSEETPALSFSFSADKPYEQKVIGKDLYGGVTKYPALSDTQTTKEEDKSDNKEEVSVKNFVGSSESAAKAWCSENDIYYSSTTQIVNDPSKDGIIISQDATGTVKKGVTIKFTIGKYESSSENANSNSGSGSSSGNSGSGSGNSESGTGDSGSGSGSESGGGSSESGSEDSGSSE